MLKKRQIWSMTLSVALSVGCTAVHAGNLMWRGVNLTAMGLYKGAGLPTSPADGLVGFNLMAGDGLPANLPANSWLFAPVTNFTTANTLADSSGNSVPGRHDLDAETFLAWTVYFYGKQPDNPHVRFGSQLIASFTTVHANADIFGPGTPKGIGVGGGGFGDLFFAPFTVGVFGAGNDTVKYSVNNAIFVAFPTGNYNRNNAFSLGSNAYGITTFSEWWVNFPKFHNIQIHAFNIYMVNFNNSNFNTTAIDGQPTGSYRTGQQLILNYDVSYPFDGNKLRVGPLFSLLQQVTNDKLNGSTVYNSKEHVVATGAELYYSPNHSLNFSAKYFQDVSVRNTFKSKGFWFNVAYAF